MQTERFEVAGRVQGVGFRLFVRQHARALNLAGWVRNMPSGSVELFARGTTQQLDQLEGHLRSGPPGARVDSVLRAALVGESEVNTPFSIVR